MKASDTVLNEVYAQNSVCRPKLTGLSGVAFRTGDPENTSRFFTEFLGYERLAEPEPAAGMTLRINERQTIEMLPAAQDDPFRLVSLTIETEDSAALRRYLESKGCAVFAPGRRSGLHSPDFCVEAPGGVVCDFVQRCGPELPAGKLGDRRIAQRMSHVGFMTPDPEAAFSFYVGLLGFREVWRGGPDPAKVSWVHLRLPEGHETVELMLFEERPTRFEMGHMNHLCLEVPDVEAVRERLRRRELPAGCPAPSPVSVGINRKRQVNYYNIDGTRVEMMEACTIDGAAAPSSSGVLMKFRGTE